MPRWLVQLARTKGTERRSIRVGRKVPSVDTAAVGIATMSLLVCFSGKIGSGKSSVSKAVADVLGCRHASFGDYLRQYVAWHGGDPVSRKLLQDLGWSWIEQNPKSFCTNVLAAGKYMRGEDFVLDGIRHVEVLPYLERIADPSKLRLIFLKTYAELRRTRIRKRSANLLEDFDRAGSHVVEAEMEDQLPKIAHAIVDGSLNMRDVIKQCIGLIRQWR